MLPTCLLGGTRQTPGTTETARFGLRFLRRARWPQSSGSSHKPLLQIFVSDLKIRPKLFSGTSNKAGRIHGSRSEMSGLKGSCGLRKAQRRQEEACIASENILSLLSARMPSTMGLRSDNPTGGKKCSERWKRTLDSFTGFHEKGKINPSPGASLPYQQPRILMSLLYPNCY